MVKCSLSSSRTGETSSLQVAEGQQLLGAGLDARRLQAAVEPLGAEGALLDDAPHPGRVRRVRDFRGLSRRRVARPRLAPVEAARAVGAPGHAEAAADAAVEVHHHDPVRPLVGGLGRADPDAGRVLAVVAEDHDVLVLEVLAGVLLLVAGERVVIRRLPDPLDLVPLRVGLVGERRDVVLLVAGADALAAIVRAVLAQCRPPSPSVCRRTARRSSTARASPGLSELPAGGQARRPRGRRAPRA